MYTRIMSGGMACDAEIRGRERYRQQLRRLSDFYLECQYETDNLEDKQAIIDYFRNDEVFDEIDEFLYVIYNEACDVDRSVMLSSSYKQPIKTLDLFNSTSNPVADDRGESS